MSIQGARTEGPDDIEIFSKFAPEPPTSVEQVDALGGDDLITFLWSRHPPNEGEDPQLIYRVSRELDGGAGLDTLVFHSDPEDGGAGLVDARTGQIKELAFTGIERVELHGRDGDDILYGLDGDDFLSGRAGDDQAHGGAGDDRYKVNEPGDLVFENPDEGYDTVEAELSYRLPPNVEELLLLRSVRVGIGNDGDNKLVGNGADNEFYGRFGADLIDGRAGADLMHGGPGDDIYVVDNVGDMVDERSSDVGGIDTVRSSLSYALGAYVENLELTGTGDLDGTGNALANRLTGNAGVNRLDGGAGADSLAGRGGNDTYIVDHSGDEVVETATGGRDGVIASVSHRLDTYVEKLALAGSAAINGVGNGGHNVITGNGAANILRGLAGNDTLRGGAGNDRLLGGAGHDSLRGEAGADGFYFDAALDAATNVDDIIYYSVADDTIFLDRDVFSGIGANGTLGAAAFRAGTAALDASDRILYDQPTGRIFYDADGAGGAAAILFATVADGTALTRLDFSAYDGPI